MVWRKSFAAFLIFLAISPAWGGVEPVGNVTAARATFVRETPLTPGSTILSGDVISVSTNGAARVSLGGGTQTEILGNSSMRMSKSADKIEISLERGQASFHTAAGAQNLRATITDATVRPVDGAETSAILQVFGESHAIIAAQKGALLVTTAHDGRTFTLNEGQAADLSGTTDTDQNSGTIPAGKAAPGLKPLSKKGMIWAVAIVGGGTIVTAYMLSRNETSRSSQSLQNEISPTKLN